MKNTIGDDASQTGSSSSDPDHEMESDPIVLASGLQLSNDTITPLISHQMEIANALCILTNLIATTPSDVVLGRRNTYENPICEAIHRLLNRSAPLNLEREPIPRMKESRELIDIRCTQIDTKMLRDLLDFIQRNAVLGGYKTFDDILSELDKWKGGEHLFLEPVVKADVPMPAGLESHP